MHAWSAAGPLSSVLTAFPTLGLLGRVHDYPCAALGRKALSARRFRPFASTTRELCGLVGTTARPRGSPSTSRKLDSTVKKLQGRGAWEPSEYWGGSRYGLSRFPSRALIKVGSELWEGPSQTAKAGTTRPLFATAPQYSDRLPAKSYCASNRLALRSAIEMGSLSPCKGGTEGSPGRGPEGPEPWVAVDPRNQALLRAAPAHDCGPRRGGLPGLESVATRHPALEASGTSGWAISGVAPRSSKINPTMILI